MLTHQAIVDSTWDRHLLQLLRARYPVQLSPTDSAAWLEAKSYAYGGAIVQDLGYYPLGTTFFTDLTHYVRAGEFVRSLLREAHGANEYAFALGALAHYAADNVGHPECTNLVMPSVYPDLLRTFGPVVTYEDAPVRHTELEFAFDVVQVAAGHYRTQHYHKAVGFRVSRPVLERAFEATYGLKLGQVLFNVDASVTTFRFAVNQLIPVAARAAWYQQRREIRRLSPRARRRDYLYRRNPRRFGQEFGTDYERPGFGTRVVAVLFRVLPKIGPLKPYAFTLPGPEGLQRFRRSFRNSLAQYSTLVHQQLPNTAAALAPLQNSNLDTGQPLVASTYALADAAHGRLLRELHQQHFEHLSAPLCRDLLRFFAAGLPPVIDEKKKRKQKKRAREQQEIKLALAALRALSPASAMPGK